MGSIDSALSGVIANVVASIVMLVIAILSFFVTVFVIRTGAELAGYTTLDANFAVLSATILIAAAILSGMWQEREA
ncbi:MAG: hypothetical protein SVU32_07840 [Candidatus Nanohaloarchaea archaeon]|nr:hypothetical protein [Candidatus Nanohaloarchaea archaeon]